MTYYPVENMSRRERRATPPAFAHWLVTTVMRQMEAERVTCLWCAPDSVYFHLGLPVEVWCGFTRDANLYDGRWPIVAHPPCGCWGKFKWAGADSRQHGIRAMELVHRWGGVVEQPLGSSLFIDYYGGGWVQQVNQSAWGHRGRKATLLYWHRGEQCSRPTQ